MHRCILKMLSFFTFMLCITRQEEVREQEREAEMRDTEMLLADRIRKVSIDAFLLDLIDQIRKVYMFKLFN